MFRNVIKLSCDRVVRRDDSQKVSRDRIKVFESNANCRQFDRIQHSNFQEGQRLNRALNGQRKEAIDKYR
jgi:hypothetical protein